ncbi:CWF19-like protein 1 [Zophobas morio]|uniref:CWF19-like protein 1 n=1 Tax=Zophobas morio TaxID=2755281 RepID=UPI003082EE86
MSKMKLSLLLEQPIGTTENPFARNTFNESNSYLTPQKSYFYAEQENFPKRKSGAMTPPGYVCRLCKVPGHFIHDCSLYVCKRVQYQKEPEEDCWFCLKSPNIAKNLIVHVGEHFYLALAKGPLVDEHLLILPISHVSCSIELTNEETEELKRYNFCIYNAG